MKTFVYINHLIRDAKNVGSRTPEPVITIQRGRWRTYCNRVEIRGPSTVRFGVLKAHAHDVRAWIETDAEVRVLA